MSEAVVAVQTAPEAGGAAPSAAPVDAPANVPVTDGADGAETPATPPPPVEKGPKVSTLLAAHARLEKQSREVTKRAAAAEARIREYEANEAKLKADPLAALTHYGHTYEGATNTLIESGTPEARFRELAAKNEALEAKLQAEVARIQQYEFERAKNDARRQCDALLSANAEKYELVNAVPAARNDVLDVMEAHYAKFKEPLPMERAIELVEAYYTQVYEEQVVPVFGKSKRLREKASSLFNPPPPIAAPEAKKPDARASKASPPTLTNNRVSSPAAKAPPTMLDMEESKRRAAAFLRQQMRKP